jgi:hypothetical protein
MTETNLGPNLRLVPDEEQYLALCNQLWAVNAEITNLHQDLELKEAKRQEIIDKIGPYPESAPRQRGRKIAAFIARQKLSDESAPEQATEEETQPPSFKTIITQAGL